MLKKSLMILSIAMAALVSALPQGTPPAAGPPPATTPLAIANSDAFTQFSYYGGSQAQTFTVPSGTNKGVFVEVVSKCWYTAGATINGQPATGINTTPECTDSSKAGNKNRQILYYVPAGTPSITLTVQAGQPVAVWYRATVGQCSDPLSTYPWYLYDPNTAVPPPPNPPTIAFVEASAALKPDAKAVCAATAIGSASTSTLFDDVTDLNMYAGTVAQICLKAKGMLADRQVLVNSWLGNDYGGANLALNVMQSITITAADGAPHNVLCQAPPGANTGAGGSTGGDGGSNGGGSSTDDGSGSSDASNPTGLRLTALTPFSQVNFACGNQQRLAILSATRPNEYNLAGKLLFKVSGAFTRGWIGGWEVATPGLEFVAPAELGSGLVGAVVPASPDEQGTTGNTFYHPVLCQNRL